MLCLLKKVLLTGQPTDLAAMLVRADHAHGTRQADQLRRPRALNNSGTRRFSFRAADLFNRLPPDVRDAQNLGRFKYRLMQHLLSDVGDGT